MSKAYEAAFEGLQAPYAWDAAAFAVRYWMQDSATRNAGDFLAELLGERLLLFPKVAASRFHLLGSVIDDVNIEQDVSDLGPGETVAYWGCGMRRESPLDGELRKRCAFFGVRGPLSRDRLGLPADTAIGDPALVLPLLYAAQPSPRTIGKLICVPHILDPLPEEALLAASGANILVSAHIGPLKADLLAFIDDIVSADFVLSGSLHGAIIAAAYRRPFAFWDTGFVDIPFKWHDFAASIDIICAFARNVDEGRRLYEEICAPLIKLPPLTPILESCPYTVRPSVLLEAMAHDGLIALDEVKAASAVFDSLRSTQPEPLMTALRFGNAIRAALAAGKM